MRTATGDCLAHEGLLIGRQGDFHQDDSILRVHVQVVGGNVEYRPTQPSVFPRQACATYRPQCRGIDANVVIWPAFARRTNQDKSARLDAHWFSSEWKLCKGDRAGTNSSVVGIYSAVRDLMIAAARALYDVE